MERCYWSGPSSYLHASETGGCHHGGLVWASRLLQTDSPSTSLLWISREPAESGTAKMTVASTASSSKTCGWLHPLLFIIYPVYGQDHLRSNWPPCGPWTKMSLTPLRLSNLGWRFDFGVRMFTLNMHPKKQLCNILKTLNHYQEEEGKGRRIKLLPHCC